MMDLFRSVFEFTEYIGKFAVLLAICYGLSLLLPLTCFQVGVLMMAFWFLNLYNSQ